MSWLISKTTIHLLWLSRVSSRTIIRLWHWLRDVTGHGLLTTRLVASGKQMPVDVAQVVYPLVPFHVVLRLSYGFFHLSKLIAFPVNYLYQTIRHSTWIKTKEKIHSLTLWFSEKIGRWGYWCIENQHIQTNISSSIHTIYWNTNSVIRILLDRCFPSSVRKKTGKKKK